MKFLSVLLLLPNLCLAQISVMGKWKTIDDHTGREKSIVEIEERNEKVYGKIIKIFTVPGKDPDPVCDQCPVGDSRYNKKIIGLEIIQNMVKDGNAYIGGTILDPEAGKIYDCKIWLENDNLKVRGYWGIFYRTQTWVRAQ
jgi:uncharacterized protein (DUF2147 family)